MLSGRACVAAAALAALALAILGPAGAAEAKTSLGGQRVGTSSGAFLRIGLGARPAAMAGAFVAICNDVTACAWNPAGLVHLEASQVALSHISWPADISYSHACYGIPVRSLDGAVALQFGSLSADLVETQEYYPYGTGREFTFSDWLFGVSVAKRFTDKFSGGIAAKYVREDLGVEVGGPTTNALVLDAGTQYKIGPRNLHLAVALMNFGPDMTPGGSYTKRTTAGTADAEYQGYAPATEFKFGVAFSPVTTASLESVVDVELCHPADNEETIRIGGEAVVMGTLAVRGGHDLNADELKTSFGVGLKTDILRRSTSLDYGVTLSEHLGTVHRVSLTVDLGSGAGQADDAGAQ
ncbi:MAG: PorV/PorQ family protein [bacterium]